MQVNPSNNNNFLYTQVDETQCFANQKMDEDSIQTTNHSNLLDFDQHKSQNLFKKIIGASLKDNVFGKNSDRHPNNSGNILEDFNNWFPERQEIEIPSQDVNGNDVFLNGYVLQSGKENAPTAIFFSGSHGITEEYSPPFIKKLQDDGYNVIVFNYQGFGGSDGAPSPQGIKNDATAVYNWVQENHDQYGLDNENILAYGYSLGGSAAAYLASRAEVNLVLDRTFSELSNVIVNEVNTELCEEFGGKLDKKFIRIPIVKIVKVVSKYQNDLNNAQSLKSFKGDKVWVIHGESDNTMNVDGRNKKGIEDSLSSNHNNEIFTISGLEHQNPIYQKKGTFILPENDKGIDQDLKKTWTETANEYNALSLDIEDEEKMLLQNNNSEEGDSDRLQDLKKKAQTLKKKLQVNLLGDVFEMNGIEFVRV